MNVTLCCSDEKCKHKNEKGICDAPFFCDQQSTEIEKDEDDEK